MTARKTQARGRLKGGACLRRIDHQCATRAIDKQAAQPQFANRALGFASGALAVIGIHACQRDQAPAVPRRQFGNCIVEQHGGCMRHRALRPGNQGGGSIDHADIHVAIADTTRQQSLIRQPVSNCLPAAALVGRGVVHHLRRQAGRQIMVVKIDDLQTIRHAEVSLCVTSSHRPDCQASEGAKIDAVRCSGNASFLL